MLKDLAAYFDFVVSPTVKEEIKKNGNKREYVLNGVTIVRGDSTIDITDLSDVFTGKNIDAKELRKAGWQRNK